MGWLVCRGWGRGESGFPEGVPDAGADAVEGVGKMLFAVDPDAGFVGGVWVVWVDEVDLWAGFLEDAGCVGQGL